MEKQKKLFFGARFANKQAIYELLPEDHEVVVVHDRKTGEVWVYSRAPVPLTRDGFLELESQNAGAIAMEKYDNVDSVVKFTQTKTLAVREKSSAPTGLTHESAVT